MARKPRSDSKLDNLPEVAQLELRDGLLSGAISSYDKAKSWLMVDYGVSTSSAALSVFYSRHCKPVLKERRELAALKAEMISEDAGTTDWDAATIERLKQLTFELVDAGADADEISKLVKLVQKDRDQEHDERRLKLLEEKAAEAKAILENVATAAKGGGVTEETIRKIEEAAGLL